MNSIDGITAFARVWTQIYKAEIDKKISLDDEGRERALRLSPKSHYKAITSIETGFFFAAIGRAVVATEGEISSAFLVDAEFAEMQEEDLKGLTLEASEKKTIKQRIQKNHLGLMKTLEYFDLFKIETRPGPLSNDVNWYVITPKGRETLKKLEG